MCSVCCDVRRLHATVLTSRKEADWSDADYVSLHGRSEIERVVGAAVEAVFNQD
jgi:hypothetical protein